MTEVWKDIKGYEGLYQISNLGKVKSLDRTTINNRNIKGKIVKQYIGNYGYKEVRLNKNGKRKVKQIHRLLGEMFIPNPQKLPTVDHINRNKLDNNLRNLRWASYYTQAMNKEKTNLPKNLKEYTKKGKDNPNSIKVVQYDLNKKYKNVFYGMREAERKTGIKATEISLCCRKIRKSAGGYKWEYLEN